jgi:hypothetical protein
MTNTTTKYLTFIHKFGRNIQCKVRVPDRPPEAGAHCILPFEWTGRLKRKHIPTYRQWVLSMTQTLSDHWGITMLYALGTHHNRTEVWSFQPGSAPKLVERLNVGIP